MKSQIKILFLIIFVSYFGNCLGQSTIDLRINEVLQKNDSSYQDDFGKHSPWIEIFNSAYNAVNIGGCYLTNDMNNPQKYKIPKGDPLTVIPTRSYLVFWADKKPTHGTLHLNFDLDETNFIALFDQSGKTLIDSVTFDKTKGDVTFGRKIDGDLPWVVLEKTTPSSSNIIEEQITAAEKFRQVDPLGVGMTAIAMAVVFTALIILYLVFRTLGKGYTRERERNVLIKEGKIEEAAMIPDIASGEVNAAIALALHLFNSELHDFEDTVLTINKVSRNYSPWSSKIYSLRQSPQKK